MALPVMPSTHAWFRGGPGLKRVGNTPQGGGPAIFASASDEVWVWDEDTDTRVTDLLDENAQPISAPVLNSGFVVGVGIPVAVVIASMSIGQFGMRYELLDVQSIRNAKAATAPVDTQMATVAADTGSDFRGVLNSTFAALTDLAATNADVATNAADLLTKADSDATPTLEEAQHSVVLSASTVTAATSVPVLTALYDSTLQQVSFAFRAAVAASDSNYWTVRLVRYRNGAAATIGTKTTKATGGAGITAWSDWNFDLTVMGGSRAMMKGDILTAVLTPTGSPSALDGPTITLRTTPGNTGVAAVVAVSDTFTRADSTTSLGSTETGQAWTAAPTTSWGVNSNQAYSPDATAGRHWALVDTGFSDCSVEVTLTAIGATSYPGLAWRMDTADNGFTTDRSNVYRDDSGTLTSIATFPALNPGDTIKVTCSGAQHTVFVNGAQVATVSDSKNQTVERHGLRLSAATGSDGHRLDNFKVTV